MPRPRGHRIVRRAAAWSLPSRLTRRPGPARHSPPRGPGACRPPAPLESGRARRRCPPARRTKRRPAQRAQTGTEADAPLGGRRAPRPPFATHPHSRRAGRPAPSKERNRRRSGRLIIPLAAAFALALGTPTAGAEDPLDTLAVQSAYQSSLTEQAALALAGADGSHSVERGRRAGDEPEPHAPGHPPDPARLPRLRYGDKMGRRRGRRPSPCRTPRRPGATPRPSTSARRSR